MKSEIWDGIYADGTKANIDLVRGDRIPDGIYHGVCAALVMHIDGTYLLMRRDDRKDTYPGYYEATAGGSMLKGETPDEGMRRELFEETGIIPRELRFLKTIVSHQKQTIYYTYLGITDCKKDAITLQEGETTDYIWMQRDEFAQFLRSDRCIRSQVEDFGDYYRAQGFDISPLEGCTK